MPVRLVLGLHNHQPVGNFEDVFAQAHHDSYQPFVHLIAQYPTLRFALHISGPLLEWQERHRPAYLRELNHLVERGQLEILGGAFYEPILTMLPRRDRIGQIRRYSEKLNDLFGVTVEGMWLAERVWEASLASDLAEAGIKFTLLDDHQFVQAGLEDAELHEPYWTEDEGRLLTVFPISEPMRYLVPWKEPAAAIRYLKELGQAHPNAVVVCADDGEKFGAWPETHRHCYTNGWLKQFFDGLQEELAAGTIQMCHLSEVLRATPANKIVYFPDGSYREMTEWALPAPRQRTYQRLQQEIDHAAKWSPEEKAVLKRFLRGGVWRNFRMKYPEVREMYARMLEVSEAVEAARQRQDPHLEEAERELYRGQCNCSYWHGAFGGLYLPHLRHAVYHHLLQADRLVRSVARNHVECQERDFNLDGRKEICVRNHHLAVYLSPHEGGMIYELDLFPIRHNLQAGLARRPEPYHAAIQEAARGKQDAHQVSLIAEGPRFKQEGLEKRLQYDFSPRKSWLDHFLHEAVSLEQVQQGAFGEAGSFLGQPYEAKLTCSPHEAEAALTRSADVFGQPLTLTKTLRLSGKQDDLALHYHIEGSPKSPRFRLAVEFLFAGMAAGQPDRYFSWSGQAKAGPLEAMLQLTDLTEFGLTDEWLKLHTKLRSAQPAGVWTLPLQTVSQSEGGYEMVHQGSRVFFHWLIDLRQGGSWSNELHWQFQFLH